MSMTSENIEQNELELPKSPITVEALDQLARAMADQSKEIDAIASDLKIAKDIMTKMEIQAKSYLEELDRIEFSTPFGEMKIKDHWQIKMPSDESKKMELFDWMKEKGIYERYATVHATSLKSLVLLERKEAEKMGEDLMVWALPGMDPPKLYQEMDFKPSKQTMNKEE